MYQVGNTRYEVRNCSIGRISHFTILHWAFGIRKYNVPSTKYKVLSTFKIRIAVGRLEARGKKQETRGSIK